MKTTKQILGEQLRLAREVAVMTHEDLAAAAKTSRTHISAIEAGRKNITADAYDKLLDACDIDPEDAFAGVRTSALPDDLAAMLLAIVNSGSPRIIDSAREVLSSMAAKARLLKRSASTEAEGNLLPNVRKRAARPTKG